MNNARLDGCVRQPQASARTLVHKRTYDKLKHIHARAVTTTEPRILLFSKTTKKNQTEKQLVIQSCTAQASGSDMEEATKNRGNLTLRVRQRNTHTYAHARFRFRCFQPIFPQRNRHTYT